MIETVSNLKSTVNKPESVVDKVQGDAKILGDDFHAMDKGVSFLNSEVQELRVIATKNQRNRGHGRKIDFTHTLPV